MTVSDIEKHRQGQQHDEGDELKRERGSVTWGGARKGPSIGAPQDAVNTGSCAGGLRRAGSGAMQYHFDDESAAAR